MSNITPPDGGYSYYTRSIGDLKDQLETQYQRKRAKDEQRLQDMEESYKADLTKKEESIKETADNIKKVATDEIHRERENARTEINRMKAQNYDKFGRYNGESADQLKTQLKEVEQDRDAQKTAHELSIKNLEEYQKDQLEEVNRRSAERMESALRKASDSLTEEGIRADRKAALTMSQARQEAEGKYAHQNQVMLDDLNAERENTRRAMRDTKHDFEHQIANAKASNESHAESLQRSFSQQAELDTQDLRASHRQEMTDLRTKLRDMISQPNNYLKGYSEGRTQALLDYEHEHREKETAIQNNADLEKGKLSDQIEKTRTYYGQLNEANLRDKENYFTQVIADKNLEHHKDSMSQREVFNADREQMNRRIAAEQKRHEESTERLVGKAIKQKEVALQDQAKHFSDSMGRANALASDKVEVLQRELQRKNTSTDMADISPAAEEAARKTYQKEFDKVITTEQERNRKSADSIQQGFSAKLQESYRDAADESTRLNREGTTQRHADRSELLQHIEEVQYTKELALRTQANEHGREMENLKKNYNTVIDKQRRQYEDLLKTQSNDAATRLASLKQEKEFEAKMALRSFSQRQNELIRENEKKLADQKAEFESRLYEIRTASEQKVNEAERKQKAMVEEQGRQQEQRLAQLEQQHQERERTITQNYLDELERVKRSNAELIKKKS